MTEVVRRPFAALELTDVGEALAQAHRELGDLQAMEMRVRVDSYQAALPNAKYVKDAEHYAAFKAIELASEIAKLRGEIAALTIEWDYVLERTRI